MHELFFQTYRFPVYTDLYFTVFMKCTLAWLLGNHNQIPIKRVLLCVCAMTVRSAYRFSFLKTTTHQMCIKMHTPSHIIWYPALCLILTQFLVYLLNILYLCYWCIM